MLDFEGALAVITGGGSGIGRALSIAIAGRGAHLALCDLDTDGLAGTRELALAAAPQGAVPTISLHQCDVSDEAAVAAFATEIAEAHRREDVNFVVNNAGLSGGGSLFTESEASWNRCFDVCWGGVLHGTRTFLPRLAAAEWGHLVNVSSINGIWASLGPGRPHTAYSAAKFAVRGFSEALITDLKINAPHVGVSVVMPGHVGTSIVRNSVRFGADEVDDADAAAFDELSAAFESSAPVSAADAAATILAGVDAGEWRILVGEDAKAIDAAVRRDPEGAYDGWDLLAITDESGDLAARGD